MSGSEPPPAGRRVARNTIVNAANIVLTIGVTIPLTPFLIGRLGPGPYGVYVLAGSFAGLGGFLGLGELGFQGAVVRYVARDSTHGNWERVRAVVVTTFTIFLGLGLVAAVAIFVFAQVGVNHVFNIEPGLHDEATFIFSMLAIQVVGEYAALALIGYLEGLQRYPTSAALQLGQLGAYIVLAVALVLLGAGVEGVAVAAAAAAVISAVAAIVVVRVQKGHMRIGIGIDRESLPELTKYSWRLMVIRLTSIAYDQMDKVIIGIALNPVALTTYDIANKIHLATRYGVSVTSSAVTPAAASLAAADDRTRLRALLLRGTRTTVGLTLPLGITAMLLAGPLIDVWIGDGYPDAAPTAQLFLVYVLFTSATTVGVTMLIGMGVLDRFVLLGLASMLINLAVSIVLVGPVGIQGVVIGTTAGYLLITPPYLTLILRHLGVSLRDFMRDALARPVAVGAAYATLLGAAVIVHTPEGAVETLAYAGVGVALYLAAFVAFAASDADRAVVRNLIGRH